MKTAPLLHNPHPGETLKEALGDLGITQYRLAQDIGLPHSRITCIIKGRQGITAATGVFVIPAVPYLQALGLEKDEMVQALGLTFTVSTVALAAGLAGTSAFTLDLLAPSLLAVVVALVGMRLGQAVRARLSPAAFRLCFFAGLSALGAYLALRGLV